MFQILYRSEGRLAKDHTFYDFSQNCQNIVVILKIFLTDLRIFVEFCRDGCLRTF